VKDEKVVHGQRWIEVGVVDELHQEDLAVHHRLVVAAPRDLGRDEFDLVIIPAETVYVTEFASGERATQSEEGSHFA